ncbi:MAG: hypothetical protein JWO76_1924 [Nocardioides sp.]|nr:hypothetical protein [Nocardioides sp.]
MTTEAIPAWSIGKLNSSHPQLTLTTSAPAEEALALLEAGVRDASFKVKERRPSGFRARYIDWFSVAAAGFNKTVLDVEAVAGTGGTEVTVTGRPHQAGFSGPKKAAHGLSTAVEALRVRGYEVSATPWRAADRD